MTRPKKHHASLPPRLRFKHGAYYYVKHDKWQPLGKSREQAIKEYAVLENVRLGDHADGVRVLAASRRGAKRRGIPHSLSIKDVDAMIVRSGGQCEVTGIPFSHERSGKAPNAKAPWGMSIDRIDPRQGYTVENCRLVCTAVNLAMNEWGESGLARMARYYGVRLKIRDVFEVGDTSEENAS